MSELEVKGKEDKKENSPVESTQLWAVVSEATKTVVAQVSIRDSLLNKERPLTKKENKREVL